MATVTIQITAAGNTVGRVKTVSGADLTRFLEAYKSVLGQVDDGDGGLRDRTDEEVVQTWADNIIAHTKATVRQYENIQAASVGSYITFT